MNALEGTAPRTQGPFFFFFFSFSHTDGRRTVAAFMCLWWSTVEMDFCVSLSILLYISLFFFFFLFCLLFFKTVYIQLTSLSFRSHTVGKIVPTNNLYRSPPHSITHAQYCALSLFSNSLKSFSIRALSAVAVRGALEVLQFLPNGLW